VVSSTKAFQRAATLSLQVELPTTSVMTSNPNLGVGKECRNTDLDTAAGGDARRLDLLVARSRSEAVVTTWKVHRLWEILPHDIMGAWLL
jgi:hypothetical protein